MVEMTEAANILHNATPRSLILMDEIGRGTSTFDGLSLAWAIARHIATQLKSFTLFATHYFELTALATEIEGCANVHLDATEHGEGIVFLHAVKDGPASRSYGLQVAQLAGVPRDVIGQARQYLEALEAQRDRARSQRRSAVAKGRKRSCHYCSQRPTVARRSPARNSRARRAPHRTRGARSRRFVTESRVGSALQAAKAASWKAASRTIGASAGRQALAAQREPPFLQKQSRSRARRAAKPACPGDSRAARGDRSLPATGLAHRDRAVRVFVRTARGSVLHQSAACLR
jgi:hypothetical protein